MKDIFNIAQKYLKNVDIQHIRMTFLDKGEPLEINDFGVIMPDIKIMRNFNNFGNNELVKSFWKKKFSYIKNDVYAETNHTLCKCGLVENVILNGLEDETTLIVLILLFWGFHIIFTELFSIFVKLRQFWSFL